MSNELVDRQVIITQAADYMGPAIASRFREAGATVVEVVGRMDQGAKLVSAIASICQTNSEEEVATMVEEIVDPAGTFYRFGLADSMLKRKRI